MAEMETESSHEQANRDNKYNALKNFEIDKKIGKGQFSEVYRARCTVDNTTIALKKVQVRSTRKHDTWMHDKKQ